MDLDVGFLDRYLEINFSFSVLSEPQLTFLSFPSGCDDLETLSKPVCFHKFVTFLRSL